PRPCPPMPGRPPHAARQAVSPPNGPRPRLPRATPTARARGCPRRTGRVTTPPDRLPATSGSSTRPAAPAPPPTPPRPRPIRVPQPLTPRSPPRPSTVPRQNRVPREPLHSLPAVLRPRLYGTTPCTAHPTGPVRRRCRVPHHAPRQPARSPAHRPRRSPQRPVRTVVGVQRRRPHRSPLRP